MTIDINNSLRWHDPEQVRGCDLSPHHEGTPVLTPLSPRRQLCQDSRGNLPQRHSQHRAGGAGAVTWSSGAGISRSCLTNDCAADTTFVPSPIGATLTV